MPWLRIVGKCLRLKVIFYHNVWENRSADSCVQSALLMDISSGVRIADSTNTSLIYYCLNKLGLMKIYGQWAYTVSNLSLASMCLALLCVGAYIHLLLMAHVKTRLAQKITLDFLRATFLAELISDSIICFVV